MKKSLIIAVALIFASCGIRKAEETEVVVDETEVDYTYSDELFEETVSSIERPVYRESETLLTDLIHTKLEVSFDWENSRMKGIATITAKPHFYPSDSLILDAKGMDINYVAMGSKRLDYTYKDDFLRINLGKKYTRNEQYSIMIDYVAKPEERESEGSMAISDAKGLYFINPKGEDKDKMPQIWTQGETEASSVWFPTIDAPNVKTSQEIFITVDDKYATLSNGKLISSTKLSDGKRIDHWKQELPHAPYLFMMGVGEFKVIKDSYTRPDGSKMDVNYYVEPEWESSARAIFGETPEMIRFFSKITGVEYAWDKYHQIVVRDYVSGAMENTGAVIFGDFVYKNERELLDGNEQSIIAHELFHHWFGDLVTCESWANLPLNESFANYSQYLWDEHRYGIDQADYYAEEEAEGYYQSASFQGYHDLIWFDYDDKEQMFDGHSYNKGGRILHMLRNYLGDDAFFAGLNNYLVTNKFKAAEFHHLRLAFEEVCGEDLNWFFNQWFLGSGHPVLDFYQEVDTLNSNVHVTVTQKQDLEKTPLYKLPFDIAVFDSEGKHLHSVVLDEVSEAFILPFKTELKGIIYDDEQMLLAKRKENKTREQYIYQYYHGERYAARRDGLMEGAKLKTPGSEQLILDALKDPFWNIRLLAIGKIGILKGEKKEEAIAMVMNMAQNDRNSSVRSAALSSLPKWKGGEELASLYKERIAKDSSYTVISSALKSLAADYPEEAMSLAKALEQEKSSKLISGIAQLYSVFGGEEKYDFIVSSLQGNTVQGFDKLALLNSFTMYLTEQEPELIDKSYPVYVDQLENGGFYMGMFLPQNLTYLIGQMSAKVTSLNDEVKMHEDNEDPALANQTRAKIKKYETLISKYSEFVLQIENEGGGLGTHEED